MYFPAIMIMLLLRFSGGFFNEKKYIITLTGKERLYLENIATKGKNPAYRIKHAHILLNADETAGKYAEPSNRKGQIGMKNIGQKERLIPIRH